MAEPSQQQHQQQQQQQQRPHGHAAGAPRSARPHREWASASLTFAGAQHIVTAATSPASSTQPPPLPSHKRPGGLDAPPPAPPADQGGAPRALARSAVLPAHLGAWGRGRGRSESSPLRRLGPGTRKFTLTASALKTMRRKRTGEEDVFETKPQLRRSKSEECIHTWDLCFVYPAMCGVVLTSAMLERESSGPLERPMAAEQKQKQQQQQSPSAIDDFRRRDSVAFPETAQPAAAGGPRTPVSPAGTARVNGTAELVVRQVFMPFASEDAMRDYISTVMLTHHYVFGTRELIQDLIRGYVSPASVLVAPPPQERMGFVSEDTRVRVLRCLLRWAKWHDEYPTDAKCIEAVVDFLTTKALAHHDPLCRELKKRLERPLALFFEKDNAPEANPLILQLKKLSMESEAELEWPDGDTGSGSPSPVPPGERKRKNSLIASREDVAADVEVKSLAPETDQTIKLRAFVTAYDKRRNECTPEALAAFWMSSPLARSKQKGFKTFRHCFHEAAMDQLKLTKDKVLELGAALAEQKVIRGLHDKKQPFEEGDFTFYFSKKKCKDALAFPDSHIPNGALKEMSFTDIHPLEIARQLSLVEQDIIHAIRVTELSKMAWMQKDEAQRKAEAPNVLRYIAESDKISMWVSAEVVFTANLKQRASILARFIDVAQYCYQMKNWNGMMEVLIGLQHPSVSRLVHTWELLPKSSQVAFANMAKLASPDHNYSQWRELTADVISQPSLPYLALWLKDLFFIEEGNPLFTPAGSNIVNIEKLRLLGRVFETFLLMKQNLFRFKPVPPIMEFLRNGVIRVQDSKILFKSSQDCEPRESAAQAKAHHNKRLASIL
eukprot:m51a1_g890 putative domain containing protein (836) ;mRNA; r:9608-13135